MKLGRMTDADKGMNPLHFASDPADAQMGINPEIWIWIPDNLWLRFNCTWHWWTYALSKCSAMLLCPCPVGEVGALSGDRRSSSVCLSDVAYIGSNSKTKRPRKTKLHRGTPGHMRLPHRLQGQKSRSAGAGAYCGGHLAAQLVLCYRNWMYMKEMDKYWRCTADEI